MSGKRKSIEAAPPVSDWKVGDVVYLKSGSPRLTISDLFDDWGHRVLVTWFDAAVEKTADFPDECLTKEAPVVNRGGVRFAVDVS